MAHRRNSARRVRQHKYGVKGGARWKSKKEQRRLDRQLRTDEID